jgi:hypothetical protein
LNNPGVDPPEAELNFPIAILAPQGADLALPPPYLFVANSNFDLRYNAGSVHAYDLDRVTLELPDDCSECVTTVEETPALLRSEALIGPHASSMAYQEGRLYLAVRSDANLTYIDVGADGLLHCGGNGSPQRCSDEYRRGDESQASQRDIGLPADPVGLSVGPLTDFGGDPDGGSYVLMAHRAGRVSLFLDKAEGAGLAPLLVDVQDDLPGGLVNMRFDAATQTAWMPTENVDDRDGDNLIARVTVTLDLRSGDLNDSFLVNAGNIVLTGLNDGEDTRDVRFETREDGSRWAYILSRRPESVILVDLTRSEPSRLFIAGLVPVGSGPSRMTAARLPTPYGTRTFLFVSCFDSREIFVIDPEFGATRTIIRGLSGPFELAADVIRERLYVADFRASVVRVVSLTPWLQCLMSGDAGEGCEPRVLGTIGEPRPVEELL